MHPLYIAFSFSPGGIFNRSYLLADENHNHSQGKIQHTKLNSLDSKQYTQSLAIIHETKENSYIACFHCNLANFEAIHLTSFII